MFFIVILASVFLVLIYTRIDVNLIIKMYDAFKRNDKDAGGKAAILYILLMTLLVHIFYIYLVSIFNLKL
jgi:hypothetical protein